MVIINTSSLRLLIIFFILNFITENVYWISHVFNLYIMDNIFPGLKSSGEEEQSHWQDMRENKGEQVCRWHVLLES